MTWIQTSFQRADSLYSRLFADWLHINFIARTVLLLLMLWLIIFIGALIFKYVIGPVWMLFYVNVLLRAWNFLIIETIQEWIYIHHYSKGSTRFSGLYMRLTDRVKHNRARLSSSEENTAHRRQRARRLGNQMMITAGIIVAMWVVAFGINREYAAPAWAASSGANEGSTQDETPPELGNNEDATETISGEEEPREDVYLPGMVRPGLFPEGAQISFALTGNARDGARLRSGPGTADTVVIEMLWGDEILVYLNHYVADADVDTLYWIRVRSESGVVGYIGSHLVEVVG